MDYIIPQTHLDLLQGIWKELVRSNDPDATFVDPTVIVGPEEVAPE